MKRLKTNLLLFHLLAAAMLYATPASAADPLQYCNVVQDNNGFVRYPLGAIGAWSVGFSRGSTDQGEFADVLTRVPKIYPCLDSVVAKDVKDDWRAAVTGDPSILTVIYKADKPCGASSAEMTVSPHVSVYKITFPQGAKRKYLVLDFDKSEIAPWAALSKWTERSVMRIDDRTVQASVGEPGGPHAYFTVRFSAPCLESGTLGAQGAMKDEAGNSGNKSPVIYAQFNATTVTVAVAESFASPRQAGEFLAAEFTDFETAHRNCQAAWNQVLGRVEIEGSEVHKRMAYTAFYTMYANIIDGGEGVYAKYYNKARTIASSVKWQYIGGFQSCCWDNFRTAYPFLMLACPEVMTDVVNTYQARYQRNGIVDGNICLFTGPANKHTNIKFSPVLIAEAYNSGIPADYSKFYAALKDNFNNKDLLPSSFSGVGYVTQPATGGMACSNTLEFATGMQAMALLAKANHDEESAEKYVQLSKNYANLWDRTTQLFRLKNADGSWGVIENSSMTWLDNPQGLFEGTSKDWMCSVPHDPYGLINLSGQENFVNRVVDYCRKDTWFNDNQYNYPFLLYYAGAPDKAEEIIRNRWVPLFKDATIFEGLEFKPPHDSHWQDHYTGNAGWLLCSMLGLYPTIAPEGQFIIVSPSVTKAVIHNGSHDISVEAASNSEENIYIKSIKLDGQTYPCYMIPAKRLALGAKIELKMGRDPAGGLGDLYIASSDGLVRGAGLASSSHLTCAVEAPLIDATTKIHSRTKPVKVTINGRENDKWSYDDATRTVTIVTQGVTTIEVSL